MISTIHKHSVALLVASGLALGMLASIAPATAQAHGTCSRTMPAPYKSGTLVSSNASVTCTYSHSTVNLTRNLQRYQSGAWVTKKSGFVSITNSTYNSISGGIACQTGSWRSVVSFNVYASGVLQHSMSPAASPTTNISVC